VSEDTSSGWADVDVQSRMSIWEADPVLRYFQSDMIQEMLDGKRTAFTMEQIFEVQNQLERYAKTNKDMPEEEKLLAKQIEDIFGPGGVRSKVARSHKLNKVVECRLAELVENGRPIVPVNTQASNENVAENVNAGALSPVSSVAAASTGTVPLQDVTQHVPVPGDADFKHSYTVFLRFAPDMPDHAKVNIRKTASLDGDVVGSAGSDTVLKCTGVRVGDFAEVMLAGSNEKGYVLTSTNDRQLFVECEQMASSPEISTLSQPILETKNDKGIHSSPVRNPEPSTFVTMEEYMKLKSKVELIEADLRALRLLLRNA